MGIEEQHSGVNLGKLYLFFAVLVVFWGFSLFWWLSYGYLETFLWLNQYHWSVLDQADLYFFTHLGDGLILPGIMVLLFWRKEPGLLLTAVIAMVFLGLLAQMGKNFVFTDWYRPAKALADVPDLLIVHPHPPRSHAFPSGHATTMASGGVFIAYYLHGWRKWLPLLVGVFTVFLCFTRVVIGVHFPGDVFVGSMIGSLGSLFFLRYLFPVLDRRLADVKAGRYPKLVVGVTVIAALAIVGQLVNQIMRT